MSYRQVLLSTVFVILMLLFYLFAALNPLSPADHSTGWSDGAIVMGKLPVPRRPAYLDHSRASASAFAVGSGGGLFGHLPLIYHFSSFFGDPI